MGETAKRISEALTPFIEDPEMLYRETMDRLKAERGEAWVAENERFIRADFEAVRSVYL
jgi:hypothetical protein